MKALIERRTNQWTETVDNTDGYDLAAYDVVEAPENPTEWRWDGTQFVPRPPTLEESDRDALQTDPRWQTVLDMPAADINDWLQSAVTDLNSARRVLYFLIVAVRRLHKRRQ